MSRKIKFKLLKTARGFNYYQGKDMYGHSFTIQKSSLATEDAIWFGIDDAKPKIMAILAEKLGVETNEDCGWIDYPVPEEVSFTTRMHLTAKQVEQIIPILQKFVETGEIS